MAYLIFNNDNHLIKIAANDSDRDSQNIVLSDHIVKSVSDSDFLKVRTDIATATYDGTNVTIVDQSNSFLNETQLKKQINNIINLASDFLKTNNNGNSLYNSINEYKLYLEDLDTSSFSFPYEKSIEQYCDENSITFYHPLQIP